MDNWFLGRLLTILGGRFPRHGRKAPGRPGTRRSGWYPPGMDAEDLDDAPNTLFHFNDEYESFEDLVRENGVDTWSARDLMEALGYSNWASFRTVIGRAQKAVINSGHDVTEHFIREVNEEGREDIALTKFACYMVAMNASPSKPGVAAAQAFFATLAEAVQKLVEGAADVERLLIRSEIVEENKALAGLAKSRGAGSSLDYALFQDAGYIGLYNRNRRQLAEHKGLTGADAQRPMDFMGSRELAANLFRITETKATIESEGVTGNRQLQETHRKVGGRVRKTMKANTGELPENLPNATDIKKIRSELKRTGETLVPRRKPRELE